LRCGIRPLITAEYAASELSTPTEPSAEFTLRLSNVLSSWQQQLVAVAVLDTSSWQQQLVARCSLAVTLLPGRSAVGLRMRFVMHHRALQEHVIGCFSNALLQEHGRAAACAEAQKTLRRRQKRSFRKLLSSSSERAVVHWLCMWTISTAAASTLPKSWQLWPQIPLQQTFSARSLFRSHIKG